MYNVYVCVYVCMPMYVCRPMYVCVCVCMYKAGVYTDMRFSLRFSSALTQNFGTTRTTIHKPASNRIVYRMANACPCEQADARVKKSHVRVTPANTYIICMY